MKQLSLARISIENKLCSNQFNSDQQFHYSRALIASTSTKSYTPYSTSISSIRTVHSDSLADAVAQRVSDRMVADSRFDSRTGNASLYLWERRSVSYPWDEAVYPW